MQNHVGRCAWCGTIEEFLGTFNRGTFLERMKSTNSDLSEYKVGEANYKAWRDEFKHLRSQLSKLGKEYCNLHLAFEYVLPGWPNNDCQYEKRPDILIFSSEQVLVLEFKQHEPPPFDGFAKETRGYLRLLEYWHRRVPRMSAKGVLILTKAVNFGKKYPRVKAISPDRIPCAVRAVFKNHLKPCIDPDAWLVDLDTMRGGFSRNPHEKAGVTRRVGKIRCILRDGCWVNET